jgi:3-deoxy-manno-octulosonate cytidylyltransferase (CMP-KDO synthetase)
MVKAICIIPARLESTRFPNKIFTEINGKKMLFIVYDLAVKSGVFEEVYVASHNSEVLKACRSLSIPTIETSSEHVCGSSRVFEAAKKIDSKAEVIVNLQADQPFLPMLYLKKVVEGLRNNPISTIAFKEETNTNEHTVKIILDRDNCGIYFSRYPIPFNVNEHAVIRYCHLGLYAYKRDFIMSYKGNFKSQLALSESLEQLDFIYHGYKIDVALVDRAIPEVNIPDDIIKAQELGFIDNRSQ